MKVKEKKIMSGSRIIILIAFLGAIFSFERKEKISSISLRNEDGGTWIECRINKDSLLYDCAKIYKKDGSLILSGKFHNGYPSDSIMRFDKGKIVGKTVYFDSINYTSYHYQNGSIYMKSFTENGFSKFNVMYDNNTVDTFYVKSGGRLVKAYWKLDRLMKLGSRHW
jgi:hypothetical protein